jgi:hypothetical protein
VRIAEEHGSIVCSLIRAEYGRECKKEGK